MRVESPKTRASKSARHLCRRGIYEGLPIAFHRKCYILYHGRTLATRCNICLVGSIRLLSRSLRRCAPCPHCIRSAHFNRVRLRASPFAQDDAQGDMWCEHTKKTPSRTAPSHPARFSRKDNPSVVLTHATSPCTGEATDALLSITELLFFSYQRKHFKICFTQSAEFSKPSP